MNASQRLDMLLSDLFNNDRSPSTNGIVQEKVMEPLSTLRLAESEFCPKNGLTSTVLSPVTSLVPRRDPSSLKIHRRYAATNKNDLNSKPLLNSSTLDDLFRALALECEQYLAASSTVSNKQHNQTSSKTEKPVESNDEDYENLQSKSETKVNIVTPLKTSIEVSSPIKRHIVSISISSKVSPPISIKTSSISASRSSPTPTIIPSETPTPTAIKTTNEDEIAEINPSKSVAEDNVRRSSEENLESLTPSNNNRRRRRRTRKRMISSTTTRSSSSSSERKETVPDKKVTHPKRSCSTDYRHQRSRDSNENHSSTSSQKQTTRRAPRRDVSLQHSSSNRTVCIDERLSPLSVLLTSTKNTSDFLDQKPKRPTGPMSQPQQRRSRLEYVLQKPPTLLDRMHQQLYRSASTHSPQNNIPTHRMSSYRVY